MTRLGRIRPVILAALVAAAVAGGVLGVVASSPATATEVPVDIALDPLVPGVTSSGSTVIEVPVRARVVSSAWTDRDDRVDWNMRLCSEATSCVSVEDLTGGPAIAAGRYTVTVDATLIDDSPSSGDLDFRASGSLQMTEATSGDLALTGTQVPAWILPATLIGLGVGILLVLLPRRRARARARQSDADAEVAA